jgi:hypothetical protein
MSAELNLTTPGEARSVSQITLKDQELGPILCQTAKTVENLLNGELCPKNLTVTPHISGRDSSKSERCQVDCLDESRIGEMHGGPQLTTVGMRPFHMNHLGVEVEPHPSQFGAVQDNREPVGAHASDSEIGKIIFVEVSDREPERISPDGVMHRGGKGPKAVIDQNRNIVEVLVGGHEVRNAKPTKVRGGQLSHRGTRKIRSPRREATASIPEVDQDIPG